MPSPVRSASFAVAPLGKLPRVLLLVILLIAPIGIVLAGFFGPDGQHWALAAILAGVLASYAVLLKFLLRRSITLEPDHLAIVASFYTRRQPLASIKLDSARVADLRETKELRPFLKTNGMALPGFMAGHFRNRKKVRVFALITAPRVLFLPLDDGSAMILSPQSPSELLNALKSQRHIDDH